MRLIVDVDLGPDGRPTGTDRTSVEAYARSFAGDFEFLALIERLYRAELGPINGNYPLEES